MFSGGQQMTVGQGITRGILDFCEEDTANQSQTICHDFCPSVVNGACAVSSTPPSLPEWGALPNGVRELIGDNNHLGMLRYTSSEAQAVYEAFKNGTAIPEPTATRSTPPAPPSDRAIPDLRRPAGQPAGAAEHEHTATGGAAATRVPASGSGFSLRLRTFGLPTGMVAPGPRAGSIYDVGVSTTQFTPTLGAGLVYKIEPSPHVIAQVELGVQHLFPHKDAPELPRPGQAGFVDAGAGVGGRIKFSDRYSLDIIAGLTLGYFHTFGEVDMGEAGTRNFRAFLVGASISMDFNYRLVSGHNLIVGARCFASLLPHQVDGQRSEEGNAVSYDVNIDPLCHMELGYEF